MPRVSRFETWGSSACFSGLHRSIHEIDFQQRCASAGIRGGTAPYPILGIFDQSPRDRIAMHVLEFLASLFRAVHVEIVKSRLPETRRLRQSVKCERLLDRGHFSAPAAHPLGDAQFEAMHHRGWVARFRLADQQVHVLRHDYVADYNEAVLGSNLFERAHERVPRARRSQQRQPAVTTEGDEV